MQYILLIYENEKIYVLDVPDLNAAIEVAKKIPILADASVEVRPLLGPG
jgi:hypothetical protein